MSQTELKRLRQRDDELGQWHATFPGRTPEDVLKLLAEAERRGSQGMVSKEELRTILEFLKFNRERMVVHGMTVVEIGDQITHIETLLGSTIQSDAQGVMVSTSDLREISQLLGKFLAKQGAWSADMWTQMRDLRARLEKIWAEEKGEKS